MILKMITFCPYDWKQEGASEDDIRQIPKYKFRKMEEPEKQSVSVPGSSGGIMIECGTNQPIEKVLAAEDAVNSLVLDF